MSRPPKTPRNTAPTWKKVAIVVSAPAAAFLITYLPGASEWSGWLRALLTVAVGAAAVWLVAKLLGVRLSLSSWD
jgi:hypothetical protein